MRESNIAFMNRKSLAIYNPKEEARGIHVPNDMEIKMRVKEISNHKSPK